MKIVKHSGSQKVKSMRDKALSSSSYLTPNTLLLYSKTKVKNIGGLYNYYELAHYSYQII